MSGENHNIFLLPHKDAFIIYAPLADRVIYANGECVLQLREYLKTGNRNVIAPGILETLGGLQWLNDCITPVPLPSDRHYHPTTVTLFLTNQCNLRCSYCYASAGEKEPRTLSPPIYEAAINFVADNARRAGGWMQVASHGGGEPTFAWESLVGSLEYAKEAARVRKIPVSFMIATNGVMSREHCEFVADSFSSINLSFDGPRDIQESQRPVHSGGSSFDAVVQFVEVMRAKGKRFGIRCTITDKSVDRLPELAEFFFLRTGCKFLHLEPAFPWGRCATSDMAPSPEIFVEEFRKALRLARKLNVTITYSGARLGTKSHSFCGCAQDPFTITAEGYITGCFEVCDGNHQFADRFFFGKYDPASGKFVIDRRHLSRLRRLNVYNKPVCEKCFAKWNCAGDCPVKTVEPIADFPSESPRCKINRAITQEMLALSVDRE
jgi:uncharacterized protein